MKRTMNLVAALLCVLCALCISGCKNNAAEDTGSGTGGSVKSPWGDPVQGNCDFSNGTFTPDSSGSGSQIACTVSATPSMLYLEYEEESGGSWKKATGDKFDVSAEDKFSASTEPWGAKTGAQYTGGKVVFLIDQICHSTQGKTDTKRVKLYVDSGDSKYFYY